MKIIIKKYNKLVVNPSNEFKKSLELYVEDVSSSRWNNYDVKVTTTGNWFVCKMKTIIYDIFVKNIILFNTIWISEIKLVQKTVS